jgi:tRNA (guanine-N7-)-methyltransferase
MPDFFLKSFPTDIEREKRVGHFLNHVLLPSISKDGSTVFELEIGCGHGHWLTEYSTFKHDVTCVGIDLITKRITKASAKKEKRNLNKLFFYKAEAKEFISLIPDEIKLQNIFIMFPDPWPKNKHHKRRLIQQDFLTLLHSKTMKAGQIFFRTDHCAYFDWTIDMISKSTLWEIRSNPLPFEHNSYFQDLLPNFKTCSATSID